jgi:hypothetical protein
MVLNVTWSAAQALRLETHDVRAPDARRQATAYLPDFAGPTIADALGVPATENHS